MRSSSLLIRTIKQWLDPGSHAYRILEFLYHRRRVVPAYLGRRARIRRYFAQNACRKVCIGAGPHRARGWLITDYLPQGSSVVYLDARRPFRFPPNSIDYYHTEHMIEHIGYDDGRRMLDQMFLTLKPGGRIRIATPDLQKVLALNAAETGSAAARYIRWARLQADRPTSSDRAAFAINTAMNGHGHRFVYDAATLTDALRETGFIEIRPFPVGESDDPLLRNLEQHGAILGDEFNRLETMVLEAMKPGLEQS